MKIMKKVRHRTALKTQISKVQIIKIVKIQKNNNKISVKLTQVQEK